jgi:hypothetical protein
MFARNQPDNANQLAHRENKGALLSRENIANSTIPISKNSSTKSTSSFSRQAKQPNRQSERPRVATIAPHGDTKFRCVRPVRGDPTHAFVSVNTSDSLYASA